MDAKQQDVIFVGISSNREISAWLRIENAKLLLRLPTEHRLACKMSFHFKEIQGFINYVDRFKTYSRQPRAEEFHKSIPREVITATQPSNSSFSQFLLHDIPLLPDNKIYHQI